MARDPFLIQGHRGARGHKPENTLPSFEAALDAGVNSIETDVHRTRDGMLVLTHDPFVDHRLYHRLADTVPVPNPQLLVSSLSLAELRCYSADQNPDAVRFPDQDACATPLADTFARAQGFDPFTPPTVAEFIDFVHAYSIDPGKSADQRARAAVLHFDFELKRVPFFPAAIGDSFDGEHPAELETSLVEILRTAQVISRTTVRSFDHRSIRAIGRLEPELTRAILIAGTAPIDPVTLVTQADATIYCPEFTFVDEVQVRRLHDAGIRVIPWTVNRQEDMARLIGWGVDGITSDFPDRLVKQQQEHP